MLVGIFQSNKAVQRVSDLNAKTTTIMSEQSQKCVRKEKVRFNVQRRIGVQLSFTHQGSERRNEERKASPSELPEVVAFQDPAHRPSESFVYMCVFGEGFQ